MKYRRMMVAALTLGVVLESGSALLCSETRHSFVNFHPKSFEDFSASIPQTVEQVDCLVSEAKANAQRSVEDIIAVPDAKCTFANTVAAFDAASSLYFSSSYRILEALVMLSPDDTLRNAATKAEVELEQFGIDLFEHNVQLYKEFELYKVQNAKKEALTNEQRYFLEETIRSFKRSGLDLPVEQREQVKTLEKKLSELSTTFKQNISEDKAFITVKRDELAGLDDDFTAKLERTKDGSYILKTDYPTVFPILDHCTIAATRKKMRTAFDNRAYPANEGVLKELIATREQLANLLGYKSYAELNIETGMAKTPERAQAFVEDLVNRAAQKGQQEFDQITKDLPDSVELKDGKLGLWDVSFCKEFYKKKYLELDEHEIKQYFPMEKTIDGLLNIYQTFFDVQFKKIAAQGLWSDELRVIEVYKMGLLVGYLVLDLHPRPNKYTHACHLNIFPALSTQGGNKSVAISTVIANFPKPMADKPALLPLYDVRTFFHECGHAFHAILGATELASFSGTRVKKDFVEMPSQMLEEWLWDPAILKSLGSHYQTDEQLPDALIEKIVAAKNFDSGYFILRQAGFALMSLAYFASGTTKDIDELTLAIQKKLLPYVYVEKPYNMPYSWIHLTVYGACYYSYLWSKVFALDLFDHIKKFGLLNPEIGKQYAEKVIGKGGSKDPNELLKTFLGREPNADAFFADLGLGK